MKNKEGFVSGLVCIVVVIFIIVGVFLWLQKMSFKNIENATEKASIETGVELDVQDSSPQKKINVVSDMVEKIQDKENAKIENVLKN